MVRQLTNPDVIKERIIRLRVELRRLQAELRLTEAEKRDRERLQIPADAGSESKPKSRDLHTSGGGQQ